MSIESEIAKILAESKNAELDEASDQARANKTQKNMMDASKGARYKAGGGLVGDADKNHKSNQAQNKAIGRALRNEEELNLEDYSLEEIEDFMMSEDFEQLDELSTKALDSYRAKAFADNKPENQEKRAKGRSLAFDKQVHKRSVKVPATESVEQIDELSKDTLGSYVKEASDQARANKTQKNMMDASKGARYKAGGGLVGDADKNHKSNQAQNKAIGRALRNEDTLDVTEDIDALVNGEDLSEEFKTKAATIFEAAIINRVKAEVATLEEAYEAQLQEETEMIKEGLVEKVDGYLNYVVETWITQNEIALERGVKSDILENFVTGLKGLFEESYIDIPEEKFDVLGQMEEELSSLKAKLDEQYEINVEMNKIISESNRDQIVNQACVGLTDTDVEKLTSLAEELVYDDADSFAVKVQTIRENYFTKKAPSKIIGESVVSDEPLMLEEEKFVNPQMARYLNAFNK